MEFHHFLTQYDLAKHMLGKKLKYLARQKSQDLVDFIYDDAISQRMASFFTNRNSEIARVISGLEAEKAWIKAKRPYYNIYPGIIKYLTKLNLSKVPASAVRLPLSQICFRFPCVQNPVTISFHDGPNRGKSLSLHSILISIRDIEVEDHSGFTPLKPGKGRSLFTIYGFNPDPSNIEKEMRINSSLFLPEEGDIESAIEGLKGCLSRGDMSLESYVDTIRIITTTCLLSTELEDEIVLPDVLKADEKKWKETHDPAIFERAKRNQHFGWKVGSEMHINPHWRGPSPLALYWTGPGKTIPKYRYRKGCIVHRNLVDQIPTGREKDF